MSSCCKHYTAYDLENWNGVDRHHFNAIVTAQDLADTFQPSFQSCVQRADVSAIMCSYNSVNGVPSCANKPLLNDLVRSQWGFDGYVTGDCGAVDDVYSTHKYAPTFDATCADVLDAGLDIDCGSFLPSHLPAAVQDGSVSSAQVDEALTHLFSVQFRLGIFEKANNRPFGYLGAADVNTPAHQQLAADAARQGIVLLKNSGALPLAFRPGMTVAVIGPNAKATQTMQGNYYGQAPFLVSPFAGISQYANASYSFGCDVAGASSAGFDAAAAAAAAADATVLVIGLDQSQESEGHDRVNLQLPGLQYLLVERVAAAARGPVIVVLLNGGPVDISALRGNDAVDAILWAGYPGQSGGQAIADVIFGTYNPAGRLPYTVYFNEYVNQVSMFDMGMRPNKTSGNPGRTYRFLTLTPVYPFGFGLSYTNFTYAWSQSNVGALRDGGVLHEAHLHKELHASRAAPHLAAPLGTITVKVTNTGSRAGDDVVLLFVVPPNPGKNGAPLQMLSGFTRIFLEPGSSEVVSFTVTAQTLAWTRESGEKLPEAGEWRFVVGVPEVTTSNTVVRSVRVVA
jgi:hypothetical protein